MAAAGQQARRISELAAYSNYQLVSERGSGPGWVAIGDAFGFVDPMLSPGMWLALRSAEYLADHLEDLPAYEKEMRRSIEAWMELIAYYYDGRIFSMYFTGTEMERRLGKGPPGFSQLHRIANRRHGFGRHDRVPIQFGLPSFHVPVLHLGSSAVGICDPLASQSQSAKTGRKANNPGSFGEAPSKPMTND